MKNTGWENQKGGELLKKAKIILPVALFVILISYTLFMLFSAYKYELYDKRIEGQQENSP